MSRILLVISVLAVISGCTNLNQLARDEKKIPITVYNDQRKVKEEGAVMLWPPHSSAAIIDKEGNRCVLAASGAKSIDASAEAALKLGKAFEKIEGLDASTKSKLTETFTKLSASGAQSTFADVTLFHLCILEQNGAFKYVDGVDGKGELTGKSKAILDAYIKIIEAAKSIE